MVVPKSFSHSRLMPKDPRVMGLLYTQDVGGSSPSSPNSQVNSAEEPELVCTCPCHDVT